MARGNARTTAVRAGAWIGLGLGAVLCLWLGGFLYFVAQLPTFVDDPVGETDAIVVLTGGAERLDVGLELLIAGKAGQLLVSGVDRATTRAALQRRAGAGGAKFDCCVTVGH